MIFILFIDKQAVEKLIAWVHPIISRIQNKMVLYLVLQKTYFILFKLS